MITQNGVVRFNFILMMHKIKPVLMFLVLIFGLNALSAYSLYVNAAEDPVNADGSLQHPFVEIQDAVNQAATSTEDIVIQIAKGVYDSPVIIEGFDEYSLSLIGSDTEITEINGNNTHTPIKVHACDAPITLINLKIVNGRATYDVENQSYTYCLYVDNPPNGIHYPTYYSFYSTNDVGGGLFSWDTESLIISNCEFRHNTAKKGFGVYLCNTTATIDQCVFSDNSYIIDIIGSNYGSAINADCSELSITKSLFFNNGALDTSIKDVVNIRQMRSGDDSYLIEDCTFVNNAADTAVLQVEAYPSANMVVRNCTFVDNQMQCGPALMLRGSLGAGPQEFDVCLESNIVWFNDSIESFVAFDTNLPQVMVPFLDRVRVKTYNNNYHSKISIEDENWNFLGCSPYHCENNIDADPMFINRESGDYSLQWNELGKSPCINAGYSGVNHDLTDPDGTIPDIGAVYYPHHTKKYFERTNPSGIYWMSFPVVDDRTNTNGSEYWNELGQMFSEHMQGLPDNPSNLNNISWSYDTDAATMHYQNSIWLEEDHPVTQPKGYKVKFNEGISDCSVVVDGFKADPSTTPVTWAAVDAQNHPFENWVGYFATFTQGAGDALSRYLPGSTRFRYIDYVHTIKTQSWGTCRISEEYNSTWVIDPNTYTVSEGDMLVLVLLPDAPEELYWQFPSASKPPVGKPLSTAFEYTEKLDYTSVFLEFDPQNMPAEVGLYVNGVCKGAAVVDSTLIDVCLYQDEAKDDGELEIVFYHEGKGKKAAKGWKTYNPERMVFEDTGLRTDQIGRYAYLSFNNKEGDSPVPLVTSLSQNYPNPFNPETNISFILANDMHARLDIYNIRGQKIATLFNGDMTKGKHTLQWNGTDAQGRKVASGIYFSRLTTPEGSFSQKMMLMK